LGQTALGFKHGWSSFVRLRDRVIQVGGVRRRGKGRIYRGG